MRSVVWIALFVAAVPAQAACSYFVAKDKDIAQPSQIVFITWEPDEKVETFTVQPKFEGDAPDFGMVIPTPSQPKLDEMPKDFFRSLAVYTILKRREMPNTGSKRGWKGVLSNHDFRAFGIFGGGGTQAKLPPQVIVVESGIVGSLDYKIIKAENAEDLFAWLRDHKYNYAGDVETLNHYVRKKWFFTVMKIDTMQMVRGPDGRFTGNVSPTRFRFTTDKPVYPLKITALSVKKQTEALFYVQAPYKVDLPGEFTYQYMWLQFLKATVATESGNPLGDAPAESAALLKRAVELGFDRFNTQTPLPNKDGRIAGALEFALKLRAEDIDVLMGKASYTGRPKPVDDIDKLSGLDTVDFNDFRAFDAAEKRARAILVKKGVDVDNQTNVFTGFRQGRWFTVRDAPQADIAALKVLVGHLKRDRFLTKFRKTFLKSEMTDDLVLIPAKVGDAADTTEFVEFQWVWIGTPPPGSKPGDP